jgi:hypothetical protein
LVALGELAAPVVWAQDACFEIGGRLGWTFPDGVNGGRVEGEDGNICNRADLQDSLSYGAQIGFLVTPNMELGLLWNRQDSKLEVSGTRTVEIDDLAASNYHAYFAFNLGGGDDAVRPTCWAASAPPATVISPSRASRTSTATLWSRRVSRAR